jgi:putative monooxygenase ydhR
MHALLLTYRVDGASPAEHAELCEELAPAFAAVPGLCSMTWLSTDGGGCYGGFSVFEDRSAFDAFVASELFALLQSYPGVTKVSASDYAVNAAATAITRGPSPALVPGAR